MNDLDELAEYIANGSEIAAEFVETRIHQEAMLLSHFPSAGRLGRVAGTRERVIVQTPFILVYRVESDCIRILGVYRGARRWPRRFV